MIYACMYTIALFMYMATLKLFSSCIDHTIFDFIFFFCFFFFASWQHFPFSLLSPPTISIFRVDTENWMSVAAPNPSLVPRPLPYPAAFVVCLGLSCKVFKFRVVFGIRNTKYVEISAWLPLLAHRGGCAVFSICRFSNFYFTLFHTCLPSGLPPPLSLSATPCANIIIVKVKAVTLGYLYKSLNSVSHALFRPLFLSLFLPLSLSWVCAGITALKVVDWRACRVIEALQSWACRWSLSYCTDFIVNSCHITGTMMTYDCVILMSIWHY